MTSELIYSNISEETVKISYAIPTYKRSKYLIDTIKSIINQTCIIESYEILVVNNDPESDMTYIVKEFGNYPISIYRNCTNIGMVGNINLCFDLAKGQFVSMIHDDDMICDNYNEEILSKMELDFDILIAKRYNLFISPKRYKRACLKEVLFGYLSNKNAVCINKGDSFCSMKNIFLGPTCGTLFKKSSFKSAGLFDTTFEYAFDFYTYQKFLQYGGKYAVTDNYVGVYRMMDSASNRPEVSFDFFVCFFELLQQEKKSDELKLVKYIGRYENEMLYMKFRSYSKITQEMIIERFGNLKDKVNYLKYFWLFVKKNIYYYSHNLNFEKNLLEKKND